MNVAKKVRTRNKNPESLLDLNILPPPHLRPGLLPVPQLTPGLLLPPHQRPGLLPAPQYLLPTPNLRPGYPREQIPRPEHLPEPYQKPERHLSPLNLSDRQSVWERLPESHPQLKEDKNYEEPLFSGASLVHLPVPLPQQQPACARDRLGPVDGDRDRLVVRDDRDQLGPADGDRDRLGPADRDRDRLVVRGDRDRLGPADRARDRLEPADRDRDLVHDDLAPIFYDPPFLTLESPARRSQLDDSAQTQVPAPSGIERVIINTPRPPSPPPPPQWSEKE